MKKKISLLLALTMVVSLAACGKAPTEVEQIESNNKTENETFLDIRFVVDGTFAADENNRQDAFIEQWDSAVSNKLGYPVHLSITQFEHQGYKESVGRLIISGDFPDVMVMSADMYKQYQTTGLLWDMSKAFDEAEFQSRIAIPAINENAKTSTGALYGFSPYYGNGCLTYVKKAWLDAVGIDASSIKTFDDYYNMLLAFTNGDPDGDGIDGNTYGAIAARYCNIGEAPYTNYLPEFWQDGYPAILQDENGIWYDGFTSDATKSALARLRQGYVDGVIDPETQTASTKVAREKFWREDQAGTAGSFAYWAGTWMQTISDNLEKKGVDSELVALAPIEEIQNTIGGFLNREAPVFVIVDDGDGNDEREQKIFDAFVETMLDGNTVQMLWTYGAEDVHWSVKEDSFVIVSNQGKENESSKEYNYADGEFHLKPTPNSPNTIWKKNMIDNALVISPLTNGYASTSELVTTANQFFTSNCVDAPSGAACNALTEGTEAINKAKENTIDAIVVDGMDIEEAINTLYVSEVGNIIEKALTELNGSK